MSLGGGREGREGETDWMRKALLIPAWRKNVYMFDISPDNIEYVREKRTIP